MQVEPLGDRVLVKRDAKENISKGGIYLPDQVKQKPAMGTILAIGMGKLLEDGSRSKFDVQAGDRVLFTFYAGTEVPGLDEHLLMREEDILGRVK